MPQDTTSVWDQAFMAALTGAIGSIGTGGVANADIVTRAMALADEAEKAVATHAEKVAADKAKATGNAPHSAHPASGQPKH
jgi:hypothetical protein